MVPLGGLVNGTKPAENPLFDAKGLLRHASNMQMIVFPLYDETPSKNEFTL